MLRALVRLALYPPALLLVVISPGHRVRRADRFTIDDGAPGPYHDRSANLRADVAAGWDWWSARLTLGVVALAGAAWYAAVEMVIRRGTREGWWAVLWAYLRDVLAGRY